MPLVDYASSDEGSESENEEERNSVSGKDSEKPKIVTSENGNVPSTSTDKNGSIFSTLPKPRANLSFLSDDNKLSNLLLNKKESGEEGQKSERKVIKISVPSVSDFSDEDQTVKKKPKLSVSSSGLFSVLPPPKNNPAKDSNRTFVPNSVSKNQTKKSVANDPSLAKFFKKKEVNTTPETCQNNDDDDIMVGNSFFGSSLTESSKSAELESHENTVSGLVEESIGADESVSESFPSHSDNIIQATEENGNFSGYDLQSVQDVTNPQGDRLELDEKALQILCGGKKKRQHMPMNVIDLSGEEIMPDSKEWLLKQLTEDKKVRSHSHRKSFGLSTQERRKHQITYLAFQAKEQELELQNQWANNRMSRRQTQSKYGF